MKLRFSVALLLIIFVAPAAPFAPAETSSSQAALTFDVASVRPSKPGSPQHSNVPLDSGNVYAMVNVDDARTSAGGLLIATHQPLWRYISFAYTLAGTQELALRFSIFPGTPKSGAPFWVTGSFDAAPEYFDISARAPADTSIYQMRRMMQALLAERFHLVTHSVSADAPVFALVLAKAGVTDAKLRPHPPADSCAAPLQEDSTPSPHHAGAFAESPTICGIIARVPSPNPGQHYGGRSVPLSLFATSIPTMTGLAVISRPVVDQTGLFGLYDFTLSWMHDPSGDGAVADNAANFRDALKTQLGLELKPSRASISFLIIDRVERPSEN